MNQSIVDMKNKCVLDSMCAHTAMRGHVLRYPLCSGEKVIVNG